MGIEKRILNSIDFFIFYLKDQNIEFKSNDSWRRRFCRWSADWDLFAEHVRTEFSQRTLLYLYCLVMRIISMRIGCQKLELILQKILD